MVWDAKREEAFLCGKGVVSVLGMGSLQTCGLLGVQC